MAPRERWEADGPASSGSGPGDGPKLLGMPVPKQVRIAFYGVLAVAAIVFDLITFRVESVSGSEIGFLINNWTGKVAAYETAGQVVFCGLWNDFHTIDSRNLSLDLGVPATGTYAGEDALKIKTKDGNDVYANITIFYKLDPKKAWDVLRANGPGAAYEMHWARDYGRAICRYVFGELSSEELYVEESRDKKIEPAIKELNDALKAHGIVVTGLAFQKFRFREEYDKKISERKLADQEVEVQKSAAEAAKAEQSRRWYEAEREVENEITRFQGEQDQRVEAAKGESMKIRQEAEAYYARITREAQASFHMAKNEAAGIKARLAAEAAGVRALCEALVGEGGRNLVALEYVQRLAGLKITGRPVVVRGVIEKFEHGQAPDAPEGEGEDAAAARRGASGRREP